MKISYRREFKHNYLIIDPEELIWQGYESQMLSRNSIEGVLKFQIRQMDNGVRFYYEITSRQPLSRVLENRSIQAEEIRRLMVGIFGALERMERYLLREGSILLDPQYLYVDPDTFRVWLCLIPGTEKDFPEELGKLLEYLLGSVDHQDKESVVLAYGLYQETRKENYGLEDLGRLLRQEKTESSEKIQWDSAAARTWDGKETYKEYEENEKNPVNISGRQRENRDRLQRKGNFSDTGDEEKKQKKGALQKAKKNFLSTRLFHGNKRKQEDIPVRPSWEIMFQDEEDEQEKDFGKKEEMWQSDSFGQDEGREYKKLPVQGPETQLLADLSDNRKQRILRALDPGGQDIHLPYYPFVIGKQANLVDFQLDQDTVSRLHLRIDQDGDSYRIKDLNSTNGTQLCGRLLENNEEARLHTGDEICIARYRYRFE